MITHATNPALNTARSKLIFSTSLFYGPSEILDLIRYRVAVQ
ncbi:hypothetical protein [Rhodococcus erythropolis]|nr:hypothetical protein [Rhodococcus erythropolis]